MEDFGGLSVFRFVDGQVFVLGGPGAGKGTQCSRIQKYFNIPHLSAGTGWYMHVSGCARPSSLLVLLRFRMRTPASCVGDCLREEQAKPDSPYAQLIDKSIREGKEGTNCLLLAGFLSLCKKKKKTMEAILVEAAFETLWKRRTNRPRPHHVAAVVEEDAG